MNGRDYRALRRLSNAADETLAEIGETCEHVPDSSLPSLLASGDIGLIDSSPLPNDGGILFDPNEDGS